MFVNDHTPPRVHVFGHGGEAKIVLQESEALAMEGLSIAWSRGIGTGDLQQLFHEAGRERVRLIQEWNRNHG